MDINDLPVFSALRDKMSFLAARQRVLAENVANSSTPGFVPKDLNTKSFDAALASQLKVDSGGVQVWRTTRGHIDTGGSRDLNGRYKAVKSPDTDVTLDGNAVVLEDQMLKVSKTRGEYETMVAIYQRGLSLMRMAAKVAAR